MFNQQATTFRMPISSLGLAFVLMSACMDDIASPNDELQLTMDVGNRPESTAPATDGSMSVMTDSGVDLAKIDSDLVSPSLDMNGDVVTVDMILDMEVDPIDMILDRGIDHNFDMSDGLASDTGIDNEIDAEMDPPIFQGYNTYLSSYLDGDSANGPGFARDIAVDENGDFVVVGGVSSSGFPTTPGVWDQNYGAPGAGSVGVYGEMDVFVSKFNAAGVMIWSTYLGGPSYDRAYAVEFADNGDVIVAGRAGPGFPTTPGVIQETFAGDQVTTSSGYGPQDGFVSRISADGSQLLWSTYFGSTGPGFIRDLDIDSSGHILVALTAVSGNFSFQPQLSGPRMTPSGTEDAYYGKMSSDGESLLFGTFLGGSDGNTDGGNPSIRTVGDEVYVVLFSNATDVNCITQGAYQTSNAGDYDMVLIHFDSNNDLIFGTYFGGSGFEGMETHQLAVDEYGNAYISGGTNSSDLPMLPQSAQPTKIHSGDGFIAKFSPTGELLASTYVGMPSETGSIIGIGLEGLAVAPNGDVVAGGSDRPNNSTIRHAIVARVNSDLSEILYVEYFGGSGRDELRAVDVNAVGDVYYAGHSTSNNWPIVSAYDANYSSGSNPSPVYVVLQSQFQSP